MFEDELEALEEAERGFQEPYNPMEREAYERGYDDGFKAGLRASERASLDD